MADPSSHLAFSSWWVRLTADRLRVQAAYLKHVQASLDTERAKLPLRKPDVTNNMDGHSDTRCSQPRHASRFRPALHVTLHHSWIAVLESNSAALSGA